MKITLQVFVWGTWAWRRSCRTFRSLGRFRWDSRSRPQYWAARVKRAGRKVEMRGACIASGRMPTVLTKLSSALERGPLVVSGWPFSTMPDREGWGLELAHLHDFDVRYCTRESPRKPEPSGKRYEWTPVVEGEVGCRHVRGTNRRPSCRLRSVVQVGREHHRPGSGAGCCAHLSPS